MRKNHGKSTSRRLISECLEDRRLLSVTAANVASGLAADSAVVVNSEIDSVEDDAYVSLREAVEYANNHTEITSIRFADTVSTVTLGGTELKITGNYDLDGVTGRTSAGVTIDANDSSRIMSVTGGTMEDVVECRNLTFLNGDAAHYENATGGAILLSAHGFLQIENCTFSSNFASDGGGAIVNDTSTLYVTQSRFTSNTGSTTGAILDVGATHTFLAGSVFANNNGTLYGGAYLMDAESTAFIVNCTFAGNTVESNSNDVSSGGTQVYLYNTLLAGGINTINNGCSFELTNCVSGVNDPASVFTSFPDAETNTPEFWNTWDASVIHGTSSIQNKALAFVDAGGVDDGDGTNDVYHLIQTRGADSRMLEIVAEMAAANAKDIQGNGRNLNGGVDIGAVEGLYQIVFRDSNFNTVATFYTETGTEIESPTPPERELFQFAGWKGNWLNPTSDVYLSAIYTPKYSGSTIVVNSGTDEIVCDGKISLAEAVEAANSDSSITEIRISEDVSTIHLTQMLKISGKYDISAASAAGVTIETDENLQFFTITGGTSEDPVRITRLNFVGASHEKDGSVLVSANTNAVFDACTFLACKTEGNGAALRNRGTTTLINSVIAGCSAMRGTAVYNSNTLNIVNCTIVGNKVSSNGAIVYNTSNGSAMIRNSILVENSVSDGAQFNALGTWDVAYSMYGTETSNHCIAYAPLTDAVFAQPLPEDLVGSSAKSVAAWTAWSPELAQNTSVRDAGTLSPEVLNAFGVSASSQLKTGKSDILGNARLSGSSIDLGAAELDRNVCDFTSIQINGTKFTLNWEAVEGAASYSVQYRVVGTGKWTVKTVKKGTSLTVSGKAGLTYEATVTPVGVSDVDPGSTNVVLLGVPKLAVVKNSIKDDTFQLNVSTYATTNLQAEASSLTLTIAGLGSTEIKLENGSGTGTFANGLKIVFENGLLTFTNAASNTKYKIQIVFSDGKSATKITSAVSVKTTMAPYQIPQNVTAVAASDTTIVVTWETAYGKDSTIPAESYTIQYLKNGRWTSASTRAAGNSFTIMKLSGGTEYQIRVFATKDRAFLASDFSEITTATTFLTAPKTPGASAKGSGTVQLSWKGISGADAYQIAYCVSKTGEWVYVTTAAGAAKMTYTIKGLTAGLNYDFKIQALSTTLVDSPWSALKTLKKIK